jgi:hypothetical protein
MATIDASIPLQVRQVQLQDPTEVMGKVMNLRTLAGQQQLQQLQLEQAQRAQDQERTLADLYKGNINPDGTINRQGILGAAAQQGLGARIPGLQKQFADADKATADVAHTKAQTGEIDFNVAKKRMEVSAGALQSLVLNPNVTHQDVINTMAALVQQGVVTPEQGQQAVRNLPGRPEQLRPYLMQEGMKVMDAAKRLEALTPKLEKVDNGGQISFVDTNSITNPQGPAPVKKVATPGEVLQSNTTMRVRNMTDSRERALAAQGVTYQQDADGGFVALPSKMTPGSVVKATPVLAPGQGFQQLQGKSNMTEDQGKASGWLAQANNAYTNALAAIKKNPAALTPGFGDAVGNMPMMGAAGRMMQSPERQQFNQSMSSMSEAMLRAATGAGINKFEAEQKIAELTPQFGDSDAVVQQKMAAIPVYLKSLEMRAGPGAKKVGGAVTQVQPADAGLPPEVAAALAKHGSK